VYSSFFFFFSLSFITCRHTSGHHAHTDDFWHSVKCYSFFFFHSLLFFSPPFLASNAIESSPKGIREQAPLPFFFFFFPSFLLWRSSGTRLEGRRSFRARFRAPFFFLFFFFPPFFFFSFPSILRLPLHLYQKYAVLRSEPERHLSMRSLYWPRAIERITFFFLSFFFPLIVVEGSVQSAGGKFGSTSNFFFFSLSFFPPPPPPSPRDALKGSFAE